MDLHQNNPVGMGGKVEVEKKKDWTCYYHWLLGGSLYYSFYYCICLKISVKTFFFSSKQRRRRKGKEG